MENTELFLLRETERDFYNSLSVSLLLSSEIKRIKEDINFIKSILEQQNATPESEESFFNQAEQQINKYQNALILNNQKINTLYSLKRKLNNSLYDKSKPYLKNFKRFLEDKQKRLYVKTEQDTSVYITIDKRQNLSKADINLFVKRLYLKGVISKNEYRKAIKYSVLNHAVRQRLKYLRVFALIGVIEGVNLEHYAHALKKADISETIRERIYFYLRTINKTGHKKHTLSNNKRNRAKYEYSEEFKRLIKFRLYAHHLKESFIIEEIKHKIKQEKRLYAYFRTTE